MLLINENEKLLKQNQETYQNDAHCKIAIRKGMVRKVDVDKITSKLQ